jgi:iron complex transport system ATP-binding protein
VEFVGIVGPNGSGKTSLLKLLGKVLHPQDGSIRLHGRDLATMVQIEAARTVATVPQEILQVFPFTVLETVLMGRYSHHQGLGWPVGFRWENEEDLGIAMEAMDATDVAHLCDRVVTDLSGGERQRCMIARALAQVLQVLLLDEPTAFLDLPHQIEVCALLHRLTAREGLTVLLVSHDLNIAGQYADRILMMKEGALFAAGSPEEVIRPDMLKAVYGCEVLVDPHPESGRPRVTLPVGRWSQIGQTRCLQAAGCSKRPSSEAAASEEARRTLLGPLSFRTMREQSWRAFSASWKTPAGRVPSPAGAMSGYGGTHRRRNVAEQTSGTGKMVRSHHGAATVSEE